MFDMHSHILPGVDDGAEFYEEAREMVDIAVQNGTTALLLTPHYLVRADKTDLSSAALKQAYQDFSREISAEYPTLSLYFGAENFIEEQSEREIRERDLIGIHDTRYVLVEFDFNERAGVVQHLVRRLQEAAYWPIIAHPERYRCFYGNAALAEELVRNGCLLQINAGSPFGMYGSAAEEVSYWLLQRRLAHCVGSDAHSPYYRTPDMGNISAFVSLHFSKEYGKQLFLKNPEQILNGERISPGEGISQ